MPDGQATQPPKSFEILPTSENADGYKWSSQEEQPQEELGTAGFKSNEKAFQEEMNININKAADIIKQIPITKELKTLNGTKMHYKTKTVH